MVNKKKLIWSSFVVTTTLIVWIIVIIIIFTALSTQEKVIDNYIKRLGFTNFQRISGAVAQLKKNDLQEVFRELLIMDTLMETMIYSPAVISSVYLNYSKHNQM